jgi:hypothetical protein
VEHVHSQRICLLCAFLLVPQVRIPCNEYSMSTAGTAMKSLEFLLRVLRATRSMQTTSSKQRKDRGQKCFQAPIVHTPSVYPIFPIHSPYCFLPMLAHSLPRHGVEAASTPPLGPMETPFQAPSSVIVSEPKNVPPLKKLKEGMSLIGKHSSYDYHK